MEEKIAKALENSKQYLGMTFINSKTFVYSCGGIFIGGLMMLISKNQSPSRDSKAENLSSIQGSTHAAPGHGDSLTVNQSETNGISAFEQINRELLSKSNSLTPEEARLLLNRADAELTDLSDRSIACAKILQRLCIRGYATEAWKMIDDGYGEIRDKEIRMIMACSDIPIDVRLQMLGELPNDKDKSNGLGGMFDTVGPEELLLLDYSKIANSTSAADDIVSSAFARALSMMYDSGYPNGQSNAEALVQKSIKLLEGGIIGFDQLDSIISNDSFSSPFEHWNLIAELPADLNIEGRLLIQHSVVSQMVRENSSLTMELLFNEKGPALDSSLVAGAISSWYEQDSKTANAWVVANFDSMSNENRDNIASAVATTALESDELETALDWINRITSTERREVMLKRIPLN